MRPATRGGGAGHRDRRAPLFASLQSATGETPGVPALLRARGHTITEQAPWGAAEVIAVGVAPASSLVEAPSDSALSRMRPGFLYGANDDRRPAGAAVGE